MDVRHKILDDSPTTQKDSSITKLILRVGLRSTKNDNLNLWIDEGKIRRWKKSRTILLRFEHTCN